ncbi:MAG: DUF6452 family protein [Flavobacteriaceae bacterium]
MARVLFFIFCLSLLCIGCEKDDICNEGTPGTPRLIIRFYDHQAPNTLKSVPTIQLKEINQDRIYRSFNTDSIAIPMDLSKAYTRYAFILPSSTDTATIADTLQFNHPYRNDRYSRRACGFSAEYTLGQPAITTIGSITWYINSSIKLDTIRNEEQAHLAIYH